MMWLLLRTALAFEPPPPRIWPMPPPRADRNDQCCNCWVYTNPYSGEQYLADPTWVHVSWRLSWMADAHPAGAHDLNPDALSQSADRLNTIPGYERRAHTVLLDGVPLRP